MGCEVGRASAWCRHGYRGGAGRYRGGVAQDPVLAEAVADVVLGHPGVVRLSGGPFGTVASYLPGRRVVGVRLPLRDTDPVEVAVVARLGFALPLLAAELGEVVAAVLGPIVLDLTVSDVEEAEVEVVVAPAHPARPVTTGLA